MGQPLPEEGLLWWMLRDGWGLTLSSNEPYSGRSGSLQGGGSLDPYGTARLAAKEAESAIVARICEDFNLTPVLARAHYEQISRYFSEHGHIANKKSGRELTYLATGVSASSSAHPADLLGMTRLLDEAMPLFVTTEE